MREAPRPRARPGELPSIQALRAVAATSVILAHVPFIDRGVYGVDIFFVISGFIMCHIGSLSPDQFFLKRIFRVVPLYWLGTLGVFAIALLAPRLLNSTTADPEHLVKSLFFIPFKKGNGDVQPLLFLGWTLEYEMFFYVVFAIALAVRRAWAGLLTIGALAVVTLAGRLLQPTAVIPRFFSRPIILEFGIGIAACYAWRRWRPALARLPLVAGALVAVGCYALLVVVDKGIPGYLGWLAPIPGFLLRGGLAFVLLMTVLSFEGRVAFPASLLLIGDASYSLYLFHPYIVQIVSKKVISFARLTPASLVALVLTIGACFLFAIVSFRLFERPSNQALRRLLARPARRLPTPASPGAAP
ncbi:MAG TPA: acyltransferase [Polyangia bacterium]|nr:acyltransferase [Polyangia bacterium]